MSYKLYEWDKYSDQPAVIKDKKMKRSLYRRGLFGSLKTLATSVVLPLVGLIVLVNKKSVGDRANVAACGIGLCVNPDTPLPEKQAINTDQIAALVAELDVAHLLIRIPLAEIDKLDDYVAFAARFSSKSLLINILQDRRHIDDTDLLVASLRKIFSALSEHSNHFQIGNSVNRRKWGFITIDEYFRFFAVAKNLRDREYPDLKLLGGNIIDFELPNFARSVFHCHSIKYDGYAAQLYVDRRGSPENRHIGCDTQKKIQWFMTMMRLSRKTENQLWITETNWPLEGTEPFAPAVGDCMVSEEQQAAYLFRYYLSAFASGNVHRCYWHQLVAPGYGLVDNRADHARKRAAFYAFKTLVSVFGEATITGFSVNNNGLYLLNVTNRQGRVVALWSNNQSIDCNLTKVVPFVPKTVVSHLGEELGKKLGGKLGEKPGKQQDLTADGKQLVSGHPILITDYRW